MSEKITENDTVQESSKNTPAAVMELVDIGVSKSPAGNGVRVQVPPAAPIVKSEVLAYIVGASLGDGNLSRPNKRATRLRITCDAKYPRIAKEIMDALRVLLPNNKVSIVPREETYFDISVYSNKLNEWLPWKVGEGSKKIQQVRVPKWIYTSNAYACACLRGLLQTDGCIYNDRGYTMVNFTNNTPSLALSTADLFRMLGFRPTTCVVNNAGLAKYIVRIARKAEVPKLIEMIGLYKA